MKKIEEFWYCVSNQDELPIYKMDEMVSSQSSEQLVMFIDEFKKRINPNLNIYENDNQKIISEILLKNPNYISEIRKLVGISDKRLYLELSYIFNRDETFGNIFGEKRTELKKHSTSFFINSILSNIKKKEISLIIADYFIKKNIIDIIDILLYAPKENINKLFEFLMEPKELQQKEAKYRGHGAEMFIARAINKCNQIIYPEMKATNPMESKDPNVDLNKMEIVDRDISIPSVHSFDIIIKDRNNNIRVLIQSLIHSSDPGQYGVDKSNETIIIKNYIDNYNNSHPNKPKVYLWGSVDGVGFIENPNGTIVKMLNYFDQFIQINTTFKIAIELHKLGLFDELEGIYLNNNYFKGDMKIHFENYIIDAGLKVIAEENLLYNFQNVFSYRL